LTKAVINGSESAAMKAFVSNQHITVSTVQARNDNKRMTSADSTTNKTHVKNSIQVVTESLVLVLLCLQRTAHLDVFTVDLPEKHTNIPFNYT